MDEEQDGKLGGLTLSEALDVYNAYRAKIVAEDALINQRMSWMLWAEAILFTMWGVLALPEGVHVFPQPVTIIAQSVVSLVGILVAGGSALSISAARSEIADVKERYFKRYSALYNSGGTVPRLHSGRLNFKLGEFLTRVMPMIFLIMQILTFAYGLVAYFL